MKLPLLFDKLENKLHPIYCRLILQTYIMQECCVKWRTTYSDTFTTSNGVRQGAVISPTLFSVYIDQLFADLRQSTYGCYINNIFYGAVAYADDITLLSPTREGLQKLLNICESFFSQHGITISTNPDKKKSKTKAMVFGIDTTPADITLGEIIIPWTSQWNHLGHTINSDESWNHDMECKRGELIGKLHSLNQELGRQDPRVTMKLVNIFMLSLYGSNLWDLFSDDATKLWSTWNKLIKHTFDLPHPTHRYITNMIAGESHLKIKLLSRFPKFYNMLASSTKLEVRNLLHLQEHDNRSSFGRNCLNLQQMTGEAKVSSATVRHKHISDTK